MGPELRPPGGARAARRAQTRRPHQLVRLRGDQRLPVYRAGVTNLQRSVCLGALLKTETPVFVFLSADVALFTATFLPQRKESGAKQQKQRALGRSAISLAGFSTHSSRGNGNFTSVISESQ